MNGCYRRVAADYGRIVIWQVLPHTSRSCLSSGATKPCFPKSSRLSRDDPLRSCFRRITPPGLVICGIERRKNTMMKFASHGVAQRLQNHPTIFPPPAAPRRNSVCGSGCAGIAAARTVRTQIAGLCRRGSDHVLGSADGRFRATYLSCASRMTCVSSGSQVLSGMITTGSRDQRAGTLPDA